MQVEMWDGLPGRPAIVDADVESGWVVFAGHCTVSTIKQRQHGLLLFVRCVEERPYMAPGNDEAVPRRNRETIANPARKRVLLDYS